MIILVNKPRPVRLRRALDEWHEASDQWVEKTIALAIELKEARDEYGSNDTAFGQWLVDNNCNDLDKNQRGALIKFAEHVELTRQVLKETSSRSLQLIWRNEIKPRLTNPDAETGPERRTCPNVRTGPEKVHLTENPVNEAPLAPQQTPTPSQECPGYDAPIKANAAARREKAASVRQPRTLPVIESVIPPVIRSESERALAEFKVAVDICFAEMDDNAKRAAVEYVTARAPR